MSCLIGLCPTTASDDALLAGFLAGDAAPLEELFRRHRGVAFRVAHRLLGNEADALDAVQDGFIKALAHLDSYQGRSSFKTWLLRVVSNAALDLGRKRGRRECQSLDAFPPSAGDSREPLVEWNPTSELERADTRSLLNEALASLPESQRQTFVLYADGDLGYREVAQILGISIGTVMSRVFYARQKLRAYLESRSEK